VKNNKKFLGLFLAALVLLPGCMRVSSYTRRPLQLFKNYFAYTQTEQGITVRAKQFSCAEKYYFFDGRTALLDDIEIIYLSVHNLSGKRYIISPNGICIPQMLFHDVNVLIKKTNTITFPVGTPGVVLLPFLGAAVVAIPLGCIFLAQGIKSAVMNHRISKDLKEKTLHKKVIIKSGGQYEWLIFVKSSDYRPNFTVTMHEIGNAKNDITFDVNLGES